MPDEIQELPGDQLKAAIIRRSCTQMFIGTLVVLVFSDPMVDVLSTLGDRLGNRRAADETRPEI